MNTWLAGTAIGGIIIAFWSTIMSILNRIRSFFFCKITLEGNHLESSFLNFCWTKCKRIRLGGDYWYIGMTRYIMKRLKWELIIGECLGRTGTIFFYNKVPIFTNINKITEGGDNSQPVSSTEKICFWVIRWTLDIDKFILEIKDHYDDYRQNGKENNRFRIINRFGEFTKPSRDRTSKEEASPDDNWLLRTRLVGIEHKDIVFNSKIDFFSYLALSDDVMQYVEEVEMWKVNRNWYNFRSIPWKRGWLLYGPPGGGKTSLIKGLGQKLNLPVNVFSLSTFDNRSFISEWQEQESCAPCIALIEDIDTVFHKRDNVNKNMDGTSLTFDTLLNCIDGVNFSDGIFTIITTNKIEHVDEALVNFATNPPEVRAGRIDRVIYLSMLDEKCARKIAQRILSDCPEEIEAAVSYGTGKTGAVLQEYCNRIALKRFWEEGHQSQYDLDVAISSMVQIETNHITQDPLNFARRELTKSHGRNCIIS